MQRAAPKDKWLSNTLKCSISYDLHHCQPIWVTYGLTSRLLRSLVWQALKQPTISVDNFLHRAGCTLHCYWFLCIILFVKWVQAVKLLWLWNIALIANTVTPKLLLSIYLHEFLNLTWTVHAQYAIVIVIVFVIVLASRNLLKQNTALHSTFLWSVCPSQAWHLNFSQVFDWLGHENHIFSDSISSRLTTVTILTTWLPDHLGYPD